MVVDALGIELHDLFVLFDGQLQHVLRSAAALHVSERTQINMTEQAVGFQVLRIALQDFLGLRDGIANAPGPRI